MAQCICTFHTESDGRLFVIVWPKCTLAASHAPWWVTVSMPMGQTDGRTPDLYITLSARRDQRNKYETRDKAYVSAFCERATN